MKWPKQMLATHIRTLRQRMLPSEKQTNTSTWRTKCLNRTSGMRNDPHVQLSYPLHTNYAIPSFRLRCSYIAHHITHII